MEIGKKGYGVKEIEVIIREALAEVTFEWTEGPEVNSLPE